MNKFARTGFISMNTGADNSQSLLLTQNIIHGSVACFRRFFSIEIIKVFKKLSSFFVEKKAFRSRM